jgi:hypothetical protein
MSRDIIFPNDAVHNVNVNVRDFVPGKPGKSPYIGDDGYWYIYDEATDSWVKTDVYAKAADDAKADAEAAAAQASYYRDIALTAKNEANAFSQDAYLYRNQAVSAKNDAVYAKVDAQSAQTAAETAQGKAEDAQEAAEDAADRAEAAAASSSGMTNEAKDALLACLEKVAWVDEHGQDYLDALEAALYPPTNLVSISAVYTQSGTVYDTDTLDSLKPDLVVTAHYDDSATAVITGYTLSGTLTAGTSTITVSYSGKTTTFNATITSYKNRMHYSYANGDLSRIAAGNNYSDDKLKLDYTYSNKRRVFAITNGEKAYIDYSTQAETIYYPIPIPQSATSVTVAITPNTQFVASMKYSYANGVYTGVSDTGWKQNTFTMAVDPSTEQYLSINCKYNSSGTSYPTEPTELTIQFS